MKTVRRFVRERRRTFPLSQMARACESYLRVWHNEDHYNFSRNGEGFALGAFRRWYGGNACCVWDLGAHLGEWARDAHSVLGDVRVFSFELIRPIADRLAETCDKTWHSVFALGLSDIEGRVEACWNRDLGNTSSLMPREESPLFQEHCCEAIAADLSTIDNCVAKGLTPPVLLKIDVEGAEASVFRGAIMLLNGSSAPDLIQFEYGQTWIPFGETLRATWRLLTDAGYSVGRLFPDHVEFKEYDYFDEHFRMGNYIAVRNSGLVKLLANE